MLIACSECKHQVSDKALVCPHCGNPIPAQIMQEFVDGLKNSRIDFLEPFSIVEQPGGVKDFKIRIQEASHIYSLNKTSTEKDECIKELCYQKAVRLILPFFEKDTYPRYQVVGLLLYLAFCLNDEQTIQRIKNSNAFQNYCWEKYFVSLFLRAIHFPQFGSFVDLFVVKAFKIQKVTDWINESSIIRDIFFNKEKKIIAWWLQKGLPISLSKSRPENQVKCYDLYGSGTYTSINSTPLSKAVENDDVEEVRYLLGFGADPNVYLSGGVGFSGKPYKSDPLITKIKSVGVYKALIKAGMNPYPENFLPEDRGLSDDRGYNRICLFELLLFKKDLTDKEKEMFAYLLENDGDLEYFKHIYVDTGNVKEILEKSVDKKTCFDKWFADAMKKYDAYISSLDAEKIEIAKRKRLLEVAETVRKGLKEKQEEERKRKLLARQKEERKRKDEELVRDSLIVSASLDGKEIKGAVLKYGSRVVKLPVRIQGRKCCIWNGGWYVLEYTHDKVKYVGLFLPSRVKDGRCAIVPLYKKWTTAEFVETCKKEDKLSFLWFVLLSSIESFFVASFIGLFVAGCIENGYKIVIGIFSFVFVLIIMLNILWEKRTMQGMWRKISDTVEYKMCQASSFKETECINFRN